MKTSRNIDINYKIKNEYNICRSYDAQTDKAYEQANLSGVTVKNLIKHRSRRRTYSPKTSNKQRVYYLFEKLDIAIQTGDLNELKEVIKKVYETYDKTMLANIYYENDNPIRHTHLITLACEHKQVLILHFLLHQSDILYYLPSSGTVVEKAYKQALRETMNSHDFQLLEMLYDYLSGVVHWPSLSKYPDSDKTIKNLNTLGHMLIESKNSCKKSLEAYEQMLVDVHCLINFNNFRIDLYDKLCKSKITINKSAPEIDLRKREVDSIKTVISNGFEVYELFTVKNIRYTKDFEQDKDILEPQLQSDTSIYLKYLLYRMYEVYYRKMDFNIALLILNNLHLLKQRLNLPDGAYQEIECTLYYFLYHAKDDWRMYLPDDRPKCKKPNPIAIWNKNRTNVENVLYDPYRLLNGPVIYLECLKFRNSLRKFVNTLEHTVIESNLRWKIPEEEKNSLTLLPYMRDDYSLKKMVRYIEAISKVTLRQDKVRNLLVIQRIIQVIGEFLKNGDTESTCHLSSTTKALLQTEIPKIIIKNIQNLREAFSHCRDGWMIKRIDIENYQSHLLEELISDIKKIGNSIHEVIKLYQPILEKRIIEMGMQLIEDRYNDLPLIAKQFKFEIDSLHKLFADANHDKFLKLENDFLMNKWYKEGLTRGLYREIFALDGNKTYLYSKFNEKLRLSEKNVMTKIPKYKIDIQNTLKAMKIDIELWISVKKRLGYLPDVVGMNYPDKKFKKKIIDELKKNKICKSSLNKTKELLENLRDWSDDWVQIKLLFDFFFMHATLFKKHNTEILKLKNDVDNGHLDETGIDNATRLIDLLLSEAESYCINHSLAVDVTRHDANNDFKAIMDLSSIMKKKLFLTKEESDYLLQNINFVCRCVVNKSSTCEHCVIVKKIQSSETLSVKEYKKIKSLNINDKCKKTVENLVINCKRDNKFLVCLVNRAKHLSDLLGGVSDRTQLVLRYKNDCLFRISMELVISDIMNVFLERLKELVNVRFCRMLSEIPLRILLAHGNPHLDVIGPVLDANDFPRALISFALDFIEEGKYLKEYLLKLYEDNVDHNDLCNSSNLSAEQLNLVESFKQCAKWKIYAKLLPKQKQQHDTK